MATATRPLRPVALLLLAAFACGGSPDSDDASATEGTGTTASTGAAASTADETAGESGTSAAETADVPCDAPPLTDEQLGKLAFGVFGNDIAAQPGESVALALGLRECCTTLEPVEVCASYRLTPAEGATYDAAAGTLTISADAAHGSVFELTADVEDGRATVKSVITVYTPGGNPLVGTFQEIAQLDCKDGAEVPAEPVLNELWFHADGTFSATWMPFETYFDYWGTYVHDVAKGTLDLTVDGGNYVPPDVDGSGTFRFDGDQLVLEDMWLGSAQTFTGKPACGHRLE
jgi:hypothetical protein